MKQIETIADYKMALQEEIKQLINYHNSFVNEEKANMTFTKFDAFESCGYLKAMYEVLAIIRDDDHVK